MGTDPRVESSRLVRYSLASADPEDPDEDMIAIPRWALGVLAEELTLLSECGGANDEVGCPRCDAIRIAKWASECARG